MIAVRREPDAVELEIHKEHECIRTLLRQIEETRDLCHLLAELRRLTPLLEVHFAREEAPDGLYPMVERDAPGNLLRLERLLAQHGEILSQVREIEVRLHEVLQGPVAECFHRAASLVGKLREHESKENELLIDTVSYDLGAGD